MIFLLKDILLIKIFLDMREEMFAAKHLGMKYVRMDSSGYAYSVQNCGTFMPLKEWQEPRNQGFLEFCKNWG